MKKLLILILLTWHLPALAENYYISTDGTNDNLGTKLSPYGFDYLEKFINHSGDTFIVLPGEYKNHWITRVHGSEGNPVTIKSSVWMGAKLIGVKEKRFDNDEGSRSIIQIKGDYTDFIGFEIYDNPENGNRYANSGTEFYWSSGLNLYGEGAKIINNVIHDVILGCSMWSPAIGSEMIGNIVYNIGWVDMKSPRSSKGHGHLFYIQNKDGVTVYKKMTGNLGWGTASAGVHLYTEKGNIEYFDIKDNLVFNTIGYNLKPGPGVAFYLGGFNGANYLKFRGNHIQGTVNVGYNLGTYYQDQDRFRGETIDVIFDDNYIIGQVNLNFIKNFLSFKNNTLISKTSLLTTTQTRDYPGVQLIWDYPIEGNNFYSLTSERFRVGHTSHVVSGTKYYEKPQHGWEGSNSYIKGVPQNKTVLIDNEFDDRVTVLLYNYDSLNHIDVDLSGTFSNGDTIEVRDIQNIQDVLYKGTYANKFSFPTTLTKLARFYGNIPTDHAKHTGKEFNAFLVRKITGGKIDEPKPRPTPDPIASDCVTKDYTDSLHNVLMRRILDIENLIKGVDLKVKNHKIIVEE